MNSYKYEPVIGADLKAKREALGLTQTTVARKASLSHPSYLSAIERGLQPGSKTLRRICKVLEIDPAKVTA